jgi:hypothetical protein
LCESVRVTLELIGEKPLEDKSRPPPLPPRKPKDPKKARLARKKEDTMKELHTSERTYSLALFTIIKVR